jgi:DNA-binding CsgD family transcriptional regulator
MWTGPAGIGKTAVWEWMIRHAAGGGWQVLSTRCTAAEAVLAWVGLTDLVGPQCDAAISRLPAPQRDALEVATLRARAGEVPPDERAVGMALGAVLTVLAADNPVLVAIDDLSYLDSASDKALRFALRRLDDHARVRVIATDREPSQPVTDALAGGTTRVEVGPLSVAGLFQLIRSRAGLVLGRPTLLRVHRTSGGNPLYALELARALGRREISAAPGGPLDLPRTLLAVVADGVQRLDRSTRQVLAATAAATSLAVADVDAVALAEAVAGELVVVDADVVRAAHPLLAMAAYGSLSPGERAELHYRLAADSADPIERARQLALATTVPDEDVARALDEGATVAASRGAADAAADLARLAVERTGDADSARVIRLARMADLQFQAGDVAGAVDAQRSAVWASPPGGPRARQRIRLAEFIVEVDGWNAAIPLLRQAITDAADDPVVAAEAHLTIAAVSYDDLRAATEHAERAVGLIELIEAPDPAVLAGTLVQAAGAGFRAGRGLDHERFRRAIELERAFPTRRLSDRADAGYAALLKYADELDLAEHLLADLLAEAETSGDLSSIAYVHAHLPQIALWRGDLPGARRLAEEYLSVAESAGLGAHLASAYFLTGLVAAYDGRTAHATDVLTGDLTRAQQQETLWDQQRLHGVLGFLAWSRGEEGSAVMHLDRWHALVDQIGLGEPGYARYHLDYTEVLVATGRLDDAERFLDGLADQADRTGRGYARAVVATGRALVRAAGGDIAAALDSIGHALRQYERLPLRFDRARSLLVAGQVHRRAKAKLAARDALTGARDAFAAMGAPLWEARAADELSRVNIRPAASTQLTPTEARVARLAARGMTNRQVADALFLATKTIEANIARIYRKLGISSRAELGARLGDHYGPT